jgi:CheY-like chemotaxis protein
VALASAADGDHARLQLTLWSQDRAAPLALPADTLETGQSLLALCQGTINLSSAAPGALEIAFTVPVARHLTVLVIEDNADTLQLYQRYLAESRYRFLGAHSPQMGLALAASEAPQVIVLDVMMPESDGWAVLGQLRVHPQTQDIPVIVCSIVPQGRLAQSLGAAEFIRKPISQGELLAALDRQVHRSHSIRA